MFKKEILKEKILDNARKRHYVNKVFSVFKMKINS